MNSDAREGQLIANLCAFASALMLLALVTSALIRLAHDGCTGAVYPESLISIARVMHRIATASVGILLIVVAFLVWRCRPVVRSRIVVLGILIVLTMFLAVLGQFTSGNPLPAIVIGNVVGGMALMVLFWRLRLDFLPRGSHSRPDRTLSVLATSARSLSALQIWLGSWVAGLIVAFDCRSRLFAGELRLWPDAAGWTAMNPFAIPANSGLAPAQALNWLTSVHEISAALVLVAIAMLYISLRRYGGGLHRNALVLLALLGLQIVLGFTSVFVEYTLWIGALHNAVAALLLVKLVDIHYRLHRI